MPTLLVDLRAVYFLYYTALGSLFPFLNLYYARIGLTGVQIGSLAALPALVGAVGSISWGAVADKFRWHRGILSIAVGGAVGCVFFLSRATSFPALVVWTALLALVGSPISPILDSLTIHRSARGAGSYGQVRVWGTVGWAVATLVVGYLIGRTDIRWIFYSYMVCLACTLGAFLVQAAPSSDVRPRLAHDLRTLITNPRVLLFLASAAALGTSLGGASHFLSLYLDELGADETVIGVAWALAAVSEIPVMLGSAHLVRRFGLERMLRVSFLSFAGRWLCLSYVPSAPWALALQLLHGVSFGAFLVGGVTFTYQLAPAGLGTTAQAIFSTVSFGLSSLAGALLGGYVYDMAGLRVLFRILSGVTLAGFVLLALASRRAAGWATPGNSKGDR